MSEVKRCHLSILNINVKNVVCQSLYQIFSDGKH